MRFVKMEGCANDFIVTSDIADGSVKYIATQAPRLCDRRRGIGADGIVLVLPSSIADYKMRIINADGSEAEMCGNGIRCFAIYLKHKGMIVHNHVSVETLSGVQRVELTADLVRVDMGPPILEGHRVPVTIDGDPVRDQPIVAGDRTFRFTAVSMGNPHAVIYVDKITDEIVSRYGPLIESHPLFPRRTNVEFVEVISPREIRMRVYERGCGETMACGTGACASVVSGVVNNRHSTTVTVRLLGGDLQVAWDGSRTSSVFLTGPAKLVYEGEVEI